MDGERVGIFGGTFDPVHVGHLVAALSVRHQLRLDRVLVVVAGDPWQKAGQVVAPADARFEMVAAALDGVAGLEASRIEIDRSGPTYTIDTVEQLTVDSRALYLILGSDIVHDLSTWNRADELRHLVTLAIVNRDGDTTGDLLGWHTESVAVPRLDISSTELRSRLKAGAPVDFLIPPGAIHVIEKRRLYTPA
ncbi:MAG: nicotinate-nucleotide adenylyltransferase [Actinomycetota bacterium]